MISKIKHKCHYWGKWDHSIEMSVLGDSANTDRPLILVNYVFVSAKIVN